MLALLVLLTAATTAAGLSNCTNDIDYSYKPFCAIMKSYGGSFEFNCSCYNISTFRDPIASIVVALWQSGPAFAYWRLDVAAAITVDFAYGLQNSSGWSNLSYPSVTAASISSGIQQLSDQPALLTYEIVPHNASVDAAADVTLHFNAAYAPCNTPYTPQVQFGDLRPGANTAYVDWQPPVILASGATAFLGFDVLLSPTPDGNFTKVATATGTESSASFTVFRSCQQQRVRVWTFSVYPNGTRGPYCLEPYADALFFARQPPSQPGTPQIDANSLNATLVAASWSPSKDDGGCGYYYTVSIMDDFTNISYVTTTSTSVNFDLSRTPLQPNVVYQLVVAATSAAGSTSSQVNFQITAPPKKPKNLTTVLIITAGTVGGVCVVGFAVYMFLRRMRKGTYTALA